MVTLPAQPTQDTVRMLALVDQLFQLFNQGGPFTEEQLQTTYANTVVFEDPLHRVEGLRALQIYFAELYQHVEECRFERLDCWVSQNTAFVSWKMYLTHPRLNGGKNFVVPGLSQLQCGDRIFLHRDYFDLGNMFYERVPVIGAVNRWLRRQLSAGASAT